MRYSGFKVLSFQLNKIKTFFLLYLIILMIRFMGKNIFYFHCTITCKKVILYVFYPYFLDTGGQCFCSGSFFLFFFLRMCYLLTCVSWYIGSLHAFFYIYLSNLSKYKWFNYLAPVSIFGLNSETFCSWFLIPKRIYNKRPKLGNKHKEIMKVE